MKVNFEIPNRTIAGVAVVAAVFVVGRLSAQVATEAPQLFYSGVLTDEAGTPRASVAALRLGLYRSASGGDALCEQTFDDLDLSTTQGRFRVALDGCSDVVAENDGLYVEASVDGVRLPRQRLGTQAYALRARQAESAGAASFADQADVAARIADGAVTSAGLAPRAVTQAALAPGSVGAAQLADGSVATGKLADGSVTRGKLAAGAVRFDDVDGVPTALRDGDDDALAALACADDQIARWDEAQAQWVCGDDVDTRLSDTEVVLAVQGKTLRPDSVQVGTNTVLSNGRVDLGAAANDHLTASMVQSLAGGGNADALHTHAGLGAGGVCYTAWGSSSCAVNFTSVVQGRMAIGQAANTGLSEWICFAGTALDSPVFSRGEFVQLYAPSPDPPVNSGTAGILRRYVNPNEECAVCCK